MLCKLFVADNKKVGNLYGIILDDLVEKTERLVKITCIRKNDTVVILADKGICDSSICQNRSAEHTRHFHNPLLIRESYDCGNRL